MRDETMKHDERDAASHEELVQQFLTGAGQLERAAAERLFATESSADLELDREIHHVLANEARLAKFETAPSAGLERQLAASKSIGFFASFWGRAAMVVAGLAAIAGFFYYWSQNPTEASPDRARSITTDTVRVAPLNTATADQTNQEPAKPPTESAITAKAAKAPSTPAPTPKKHRLKLDENNGEAPNIIDPHYQPPLKK